MLDITNPNAPLFNVIGPRPLVIDYSGSNELGYIPNTITAITGVGDYVWLDTAQTTKAKGYDLYINDESTSLKTGQIIEFAGTTWTVGPIQKPTIDVKTAKFFNVTDISANPLGGKTGTNNSRGTVFNISINLL